MEPMERLEKIAKLAKSIQKQCQGALNKDIIFARADIIKKLAIEDEAFLKENIQEIEEELSRLEK